MEEKALKNHARFNILYQILVSCPKTFNKNQANNFEDQDKTLLKGNAKNIILSGS